MAAARDTAVTAAVDNLVRDYRLPVGRAWLTRTAREVISSSAAASTVSEVVRGVYGQFLTSDLNTVPEGERGVILPAGIAKMGFIGASVVPPTSTEAIPPRPVRAKIHGTFILQADELVNIAASVDDRFVDNPKRVLKLTLTDGKQRVYGIEYRLIPNLSVNTAPGTKIAVKDVEVRNGQIWLIPDCVFVLGGGVTCLMEAEKQRRYELDKRKRPAYLPDPGMSDIQFQSDGRLVQLQSDDSSMPSQSQQVRAPPSQQIQVQPSHASTTSPNLQPRTSPTTSTNIPRNNSMDPPAVPTARLQAPQSPISPSNIKPSTPNLLLRPTTPSSAASRSPPSSKTMAQHVNTSSSPAKPPVTLDTLWAQQRTSPQKNSDSAQKTVVIDLDDSPPQLPIPANYEPPTICDLDDSVLGIDDEPSPPESKRYRQSSSPAKSPSQPVKITNDIIVDISGPLDDSLNHENNVTVSTTTSIPDRHSSPSIPQKTETIPKASSTVKTTNACWLVDLCKDLKTKRTCQIKGACTDCIASSWNPNTFTVDVRIDDSTASCLVTISEQVTSSLIGATKEEYRNADPKKRESLEAAIGTNLATLEGIMTLSIGGGSDHPIVTKVTPPSLDYSWQLYNQLTILDTL
ncbi:recQ-mediated genome instability protein 1 [Pelomyxa schiedti]|nr:recQ-mediated genome instability protein 1 [Pelomyxa schiedti]